MSRCKCIVMLIIAFAFVPLNASANSSWIWLSEARPYDVLPFAAAITIAIEVAAMWFMLGKKHLMKIAVVVVIANLLSFAAPYLIWYDETIRMPLKPFPELMEYGYYFTVGVIFLLLTLLVELPIVFFTLRKHADQKWRFLLTIGGINTVTTLMTAAAERIFCYGHW